MFRKLFTFITQAWFLSLIGVILLALIIWFIGPLIAIADYKPLLSDTVRLVCVFVLLIAWGLNNLRKNKKEDKKENDIAKTLIENNKNNATTKMSPDEVVLTERFNQALKALQTSKRLGKNKIYSLPWYMIIGSPGAGKTTALNNSGLQFPLHSQFGDKPIQGAGGTRYCDWWFTNEAILIDTAGRYTAQEDTKKIDSKSWISFLKMLKKGRPKKPLNGIILTISLGDILQKTNTQKSIHATALKQRIQELNHQLGMELPVYVVITKTDMVAGFTTFFDSLEKDERDQAWGFNLPNKKIDKDYDLKNRFNEEYSNLIETINNRVLYLLDHERSQLRRGLIHQFPHQMNALGPALFEFINNIFTPNQFETPIILRGLFFVSSTQSNMGSQWVSGIVPTNNIHAPVDQVISEPKTYFVHDLLKNVIFKEANLANINSRSRRRYHWTYRSLAATIALAFVGTVFLWQKSATVNKAYAETVQGEITTYLNKTSGGLIDARNWISLAKGLNHLRDLSTGYTKGSEEYPFNQGIGLYQGHKIGSEASITYKKALHHFLMEDIDQLLTEQIRSAKDDEYLYESLKFYLMLHNPEKIDRETFTLWVDILLQRKAAGEDNKIVRDHLISHLNTALDESVSPTPVNQPLVDKARETLVLTPLDLRLYRRLKNDYLKENDQQFTIANILGKKSDYIFYRRSGQPLSKGISTLFTYNGFHANFNVQNKRLAERLASEQWIYGDTLPEDLSKEKIKAITQRVDDYYFQEYITQWKSLIKDLRIKSFDSVNRGQAVLRLLASSEKPLLKVLNSIRKHTALNEIPTISNEKKEAISNLAEDFASNEKNRLQRLMPIASLGGKTKLPGYQVSESFDSFNRYVQTGDGLPLQQMQLSLNNLNDYFQLLANAGNVKQAAFDASLTAESSTNPIIAVQRSIDEAHRDVNRWFNSIAKNASTVTAAATKGHVNNTWKTDVVSFYDGAIKGRYPISPNSSQDIKLSDFSEFFGPKGVLQSYYDENLKPFVDESKKQWVWKKNIGISNKTLRVFQRAKAIQKAYFNNGESAQVDFLLKPQALDKITTGFILETSGQTLSYNHGPLKLSKLSWPGESTEYSKMVFNLASKGTPVSSRTEGEWAWFRLLDRHATINRIKGTDSIDLLFSLNDITASYELRPQSAFNPFTNQDIKQFSIPAKL